MHQMLQAFSLKIQNISQNRYFSSNSRDLVTCMADHKIWFVSWLVGTDFIFKCYPNGICLFFSEYETTLGKGNRPSEVDDNDDDFSYPQTDQEGFGHNSYTAPSSMSSTASETSTNISSSDLNTISTEQTTSVTSECSTISSLNVPHSSQYVSATSSKALDTKIDDSESGSADYKELQEKCFSSDGLNDGGDSAVKRPDLFRFKSWSPDSEGEVNGGKPESDKDGRSLINRSFSVEPSHKKSKERKKSFGKKFIKFISKAKRQKKSPEPSSKEEKPGTSESNFDSCLETSMVTSGSYSEAAPKPCENLSPLNVKEARRVSVADSLSSAESIASPISPGYESGYMSEGNAQCTINHYC